MAGRSRSVTTVMGSSGSVQLADEADHGLADVVRAFLLGPVAAAVQQDRLASCGAQSRSRGSIFRPPEADDQVAVPRDEQGGNGDRGMVPGGGELPVAVQVAVPVERPGEAGVRRTRRRTRRCRRWSATRAGPTAGGSAHMSRKPPPGGTTGNAGGRVARGAVEHPGEGLPRIRRARRRPRPAAWK